jgi:hypothetical protein
MRVPSSRWLRELIKNYCISVLSSQFTLGGHVAPAAAGGINHAETRIEETNPMSYSRIALARF